MGPGRLTEREREVATAVPHGRSNAEGPPAGPERGQHEGTRLPYVVKLDATERVQIAMVMPDAGLV